MFAIKNIFNDRIPILELFRPFEEFRNLKPEYLKNGEYLN